MDEASKQESQGNGTVDADDKTLSLGAPGTVHPEEEETEETQESPQKIAIVRKVSTVPRFSEDGDDETPGDSKFTSKVEPVAGISQTRVRDHRSGSSGCNPYSPVGGEMAEQRKLESDTKALLRSRTSTRGAAKKSMNKFHTANEACKQDGVTSGQLREMSKLIASARSAFEKSVGMTAKCHEGISCYMLQAQMDAEIEFSIEYEQDVSDWLKTADGKLGKWYTALSRVGTKAKAKKEEPVAEDEEVDIAVPRMSVSSDNQENNNPDVFKSDDHEHKAAAPEEESMLNRMKQRLHSHREQSNTPLRETVDSRQEDRRSSRQNDLSTCHNSPTARQSNQDASEINRRSNTPQTIPELSQHKKSGSRRHRRRRSSYSSDSSNECNIQLPKLQIPTFHGDYKAWIPFYEMFNSSIGSKKGLSQVAKMNYLRSYLRGEALDTVDGLSSTHDNFNAAMEALKLQYNNSRGICRMHVSDLFSLPSVESENSHDLMKLINKCNSHLHSLQAHKYDVTSWDPIIIHLLALKIPMSLREAWEIESHAGDKSREAQTLQDFKKFIIGRANARASMTEIMPTNSRNSGQGGNVQVHAAGIDQSKNGQNTQVHGKDRGRYQRPQCQMCQEDHWIWHCSTFKRKTNEVKTELITIWGLCLNCFTEGHVAKDCMSKNSCRVPNCGLRHHTQLHVVRPGTVSPPHPQTSLVARICLNNSSADDTDQTESSDEVQAMEVTVNAVPLLSNPNVNTFVSAYSDSSPEERVVDYIALENSVWHKRMIESLSTQFLGAVERLSVIPTYSPSMDSNVSVSRETSVSTSIEKIKTHEIVTISSGSEISPLKSAEPFSGDSPSTSDSVIEISTPGSVELESHLDGSYNQNNSYESLSLGGSERSGLIAQLKFESESTVSSRSASSCSSYAVSPEVPPCKRRMIRPPTPQELNDDLLTALSATCDLIPGTHSIAVLPTVRVRLQDQFGMPVIVRALLDTGSQANFISEHTAQILGIKRMKTRVSIHSVGNGNTIPAKGVVNLSILYPNQEWKIPMNLDAFVLPQVTGNCPTLELDVERNDIIAKVPLADEFFDTPGRVDLLFGIAMFNHILIKQQRMHEIEGLTLVNTIFGHSISGIAKLKKQPKHGRKHLTHHTLPKLVPACQDMQVLSAFLIDISKFWEIEDLPAPYDTQSRKPSERYSSCLKDPSCYNKDEKDAVEHYERHTVTIDGRRVVKLPFNDENRVLGDSFRQAVRMLQTMERSKFVKFPKVHAQYCTFMSEFVELGHLELVPEEALRKEAHLCYYVPHHSVEKEASTTTKLRVVFNGSARTSTGVSLNDLLLKGPKLQDDLFYILLRFRFFMVALAGDITKMYRQIALDDDSKDYQRILWRDNPNEAIKIFRMTRMIYGIKSSGFQAIRALQDAIRECEDPELIRIMLRDFYVDDLLSGGETPELVAELQKKIYDHLILHKFEVRKWSSSAPEVIANIPAELRENEEAFVVEDEDHSIKTLGICWMPMTDDFRYKVEFVDTEAGKKGKAGITKRQMLSDISRLYDPMGWVAPVTVNLKCIMQAAWVKGVDWDVRVPDEIEEEFTNFRVQLIGLRELSLRRCVLPHARPQTLELHVFCDASEKAYAACVYVRAGSDGECTVTLLAAKSRVAPVKAQSIPRLELCGMHLGAKLCATAMDAIQPMGIKPTRIYGWTDSTVALCWVGSPSREWNVFVANRVSQIQSILPDGVWNHVGTHDNPADLATRGCTPSELKTNELWWSGPDWLKKMDMPRQPDMGRATEACRIDRKHEAIAVNTAITSKELLADEDRLAGKRKDGSMATPPGNELQVKTKNYFVGVLNLSRFSSFRSAIRAVQCVMLYCSNCYTAVLKRNASRGSKRPVTHTKFGNRPGFSTNTDLDDETPKSIMGFRKTALQYLVRNEQEKFYLKEINARAAWKDLPKTCKIASLCPFVDIDEGTLRVGGRMFSAEYMKDAFKYPWILPKESLLAHCIIEDVHHEFGHSSTQQTIAQINTKFWIVGVKSAVKKVIRDCVRCRRYNAKAMEQIMADLPEARVTPSDPFTHTGIDFAGPFIIREGKERSVSYFCVFVCFSTKAIHLEPVMRLDCHSCHAAFQRFVARRGAPTHLYSDNGTNFTSCKKEMMKVSAVLYRKYDRKSLMNAAMDLGATWCMIPAVTPHFGGIWEAGVKLAKTHLKKIIGKNALTFEEFATLLAEIEAMLNSRPMMEYSQDPDDLRVITPAMLLTGKEMKMLPLRDPGVHHEDLPEPIIMESKGTICAKSVQRRWKALENRKAIFWRRWVREYIPTLQARKKWAHERRDLKVGDLVLLMEDKLAPLHWGMGRVLEVYTGIDFKCRCVKLKTSTGVQTRGVAKCRLMPIDIPTEDEKVQASTSAQSGTNELATVEIHSGTDSEPEVTAKADSSEDEVVQNIVEPEIKMSYGRTGTKAKRAPIKNDRVLRSQIQKSISSDSDSD